MCSVGPVKGVPGAAGTLGGPAGPPGPAGASGYELVSNPASYHVSTQFVETISDAVTCPTGKVAVGGGGRANYQFGGSLISLVASYPDPVNPARWKAVFGPGRGSTFFDDPTDVDYTVFATCVKAS